MSSDFTTLSPGRPVNGMKTPGRISSQSVQRMLLCSKEMKMGSVMDQDRDGLFDHNGSTKPKPPHPDDIAVDRFAAAMKAKMAQKRAEGRGGWERKDECSNEFLTRLLCEHLAKGDPVDVANLAMMIHQRGETISTALGGSRRPGRAG